jgi:hypothetical protein
MWLFESASGGDSRGCPKVPVVVIHVVVRNASGGVIRGCLKVPVVAIHVGAQGYTNAEDGSSGSVYICGHGPYLALMKRAAAQEVTAPGNVTSPRRDADGPTASTSTTDTTPCGGEMRIWYSLACVIVRQRNSVREHV